MQRLGAISSTLLIDRFRIRRGSARGRPSWKSARSRFGRGHPLEGDIGYVAAWGLFIDARRDELLAEVPRAKSHT